MGNFEYGQREWIGTDSFVWMSSASSGDIHLFMFSGINPSNDVQLQTPLASLSGKKRFSKCCHVISSTSYLSFVTRKQVPHLCSFFAIFCIVVAAYKQVSCFCHILVRSDPSPSLWILQGCLSISMPRNLALVLRRRIKIPFSRVN